jgi:hypothetical protein
LDGHAISLRPSSNKIVHYRIATENWNTSTMLIFVLHLIQATQIIPHPIKALSHMHPIASNNFA